MSLHTWHVRVLTSQAAMPPSHSSLTGAVSGANPSVSPHAEVEIKPQLKARGSVVMEEDPKPSHQLYNLQIKSTQLTWQTLSKEYIKSH